MPKALQTIEGSTMNALKHMLDLTLLLLLLLLLLRFEFQY